MTLELKNGERTIYCPFCSKYGVKAFYRAPFKGFGKSRGSGVTSTFSTKHNEEYHVLGDCPSCKAKKEEIKKKL
ncbi:hypothetical protein AUJ14_02680 [Candidatus Micrarchaeota archaeon CG1_02_55_22]|nr:MAG: hypothetical protein AUJ14_02680 [Candidatus Micrarchaeota archaeon CG1_02_55_22]